MRRMALAAILMAFAACGQRQPDEGQWLPADWTEHPLTACSSDSTGGAILVAVVDSSGKPAPHGHAGIRALHCFGAADSAGLVRLGPLQPGTHEVGGTALTWRPESLFVTVKPRTLSRVRLVLSRRDTSRWIY